MAAKKQINVSYQAKEKFTLLDSLLNFSNINPWGETRVVTVDPI